MSDTPRTDSMVPYGPPYNEEESGLIHVPKAFARQLERELNGARSLCRKLVAALRCANNSYAGSPEGQRQIDEAFEAVAACEEARR